MIERPYDGCGRCFLGLRRLSRKTDATTSPERQREQVLAAVEAVGGHIIAWADDWEVSGATDPLTRPQLGPWLRGERGAYDGVAAAAVDRLGRNVVDCLVTGYRMRDEGKALLTYGHDGPWDLNDPTDENRFTMEAWGAQMELRAIQRRNQNQADKARRAGRPHGKPSYGFEYVRLVPNGPVDHVRHYRAAAPTIQSVQRRILADPKNVSPWSEAARLTRERVLSPNDQLRVMYGREPLGSPWHGSTLRKMLRSKAALGYLMHKEQPVLDESTGEPVRLPGPDGQPLEGLWDYPTHLALVAVTDERSKPSGARRTTVPYRLSGRVLCGSCGARMQIGAGGTRQRGDWRRTFVCVGRLRGWLGSEECKPAPTITASHLDEWVEGWFLETYGHGMFMETVYDPGNGVPQRIAEVEASRKRLRADRDAGLYDAPDDEAWFRDRYAALGAELAALKLEPIKSPGMVTRPTGETVKMAWEKAGETGKRELLESWYVFVTVWPSGSPVRWHPGHMHGPGHSPELPASAQQLAA